MTKLVVDSLMRSKLQNLTAQVELLDESGQTLGYCLPADVYDRMLYASVKMPYSDEAIARRMKEKGGRPLPEILAEIA